jgi:hypothetical protein
MTSRLRVISSARYLVIALIEAFAIVALVFIVANLIPLVAPPPTAPQPTVPRAAIHDCPRSIVACR